MSIAGGGDASVRLMTKVARMYHERGIRQVDIAAALHLSQAKVSRLLKQAVERGIVRTIVEVAHDVHPELEEALEERYGVLEAVVVDVEGDDHDILVGLGSAAGGYLESTLTGGDRIGISSWSETCSPWSTGSGRFGPRRLMRWSSCSAGSGSPASRPRPVVWSASSPGDSAQRRSSCRHRGPWRAGPSGTA